MCNSDAVDKRTNEKVAIKKCRRIFSNLDDSVRILRELKLLTLMVHPNVCLCAQLTYAYASQCQVTGLWLAICDSDRVQARILSLIW